MDGDAKVIPWPARAAEIWGANIGIRSIGEMGRTLKPLVAMHGADQVLIWLTTYCELAPYMTDRGQIDPDRYETKFLSPGMFVRNYKQWEKLSNPPSDGT
jgi:hypothetical protein